MTIQIEQGIRDDHHLVSPTAKLVAYWRAESGIPYSREISKLVNAEATTRELLGDDLEKMAGFGVSYMEARYKALDRGLKETGYKNILELAVGILPRGLIQTADPSTIYVGTDLPEMLSETEKIMNQIQKKEELNRKNLFFRPANAIKLSELEVAAELFGNQPFNICNEGLLMYLTRDEQVVLAKNIYSLLSKNGGSWITPDITDKLSRARRMELVGADYKDVSQRALASISKSTGRSMFGGAFENPEEVDQFFNDLGFTVEKTPMYDGSYELFGLKQLPEGKFKEDMTNMLTSQKVLVMTPKKSN